MVEFSNAELRIILKATSERLYEVASTLNLMADDSDEDKPLYVSETITALKQELNLLTNVVNKIQSTNLQ